MEKKSEVGEVFCIGTAKYKINYNIYLAKNPTDVWVLCLHGKGEVGPIDGSLLNLVEAHGFPMYASKGCEFGFNIIAPQIQTTYTNLHKFILEFIYSKFNPSQVFVTGLSLGGIESYALLKAPLAYKLSGVVPVCGKVSPSALYDYDIIKTAQSFPDGIPIQSWHGNKDTTVSFSADRNFINAYNSTHLNQIDFVVLDGVSHDAWDRAYSLTIDKTGKSVLQWINSLIK